MNERGEEQGGRIAGRASHAGRVAALGGALTLLVAGADAIGLLAPLERRSLDLRFEHAPRRAAPLHADIRFVDIDDGAINVGGRWPWPRERLGLALGEIARAGARTVVLDLLLTEPERARSEDAPSSGDEVVATAIAAAPTVLALDLGDDAARGIDDAGELEPWSRRMLEARRELERLVRERGDLPPLDDFIESMQPKDRSPRLSRQQRELLALAHEQERSWHTLGPLLLERREGADDGGADGGAESLVAKPPLSGLARVGKGAGFVNFAPDRDGWLRQVEVVRAVPGGRALQLGVAAALLHRGIAVADVAVTADALRVGATTLELHDGRLWLAWPTPDEIAAKDDPAAPVDPSSPAPSSPAWMRCGARCSLGYALDVAETDRDLAERKRRRDQSAAALARDFGIAGEGEAQLEAVRDEARFRLDDAAELEAGGQLSPRERRRLEPFQRFAQLDEVLTAGAADVAAARARLAAQLGGKLVFVGWTATGAASDFVPTPLSPRTPGVMAHAVTADMVLSGRALRFAPSASGPLLALLLGALATAACLLPLLGSLAAFLVLGGGWVALAAVLFGSGDFVLPLVAPLAAGSVAWIGATALQAGLSQRDQRRITRQFKARVAPELVDFLVDHPGALSMTGEPREVTAFFVDLAGFTRLSERLGAQATVALLNRCMTAMTQALTQHGAYVNKYLGDGLMAFWSAFRPDPAQANHACRAALAVQDALARVEGADGVAARIGIATGRVIVGDCGAPPLLHDYTAIGDAINLAARLESANKQFGSRILVDGATREQARDGATRFRPCGRVVVVGQTTPVDLHEVLLDDVAPVTDEEIEATAAAIASFRAGRLAECADRFRALEQRFGPRPLARVYLDELTHPDPDFDGVLHLAAK